MKRLHKLLISSFIKPLIATFFVAQFILIMQFLWQHIDELAGKGLEWEIIAELLLYASAALVPLALPLAVLLSSIMTFGNLGENFELTAIKSSGISLQKFMRPLMVLVTVLTIGAFLYANYVIPYANLKALSLRYDIKKQREEFQIREGVFYNDIEGFSIKVGHKNPRTKLMKDIMIYEHDQNQGNTQVTIADSGYIKMTTDETKLLIILYSGKTYEEMKEDRKSRARRNENKYPFQKREFEQENLLVDITGFSFKRTDEGLFKDNYQMLKLSELKKNKDSLVRVYNKKAQDLSHQLDKNLYTRTNQQKNKDKKKSGISQSVSKNINSSKPGDDTQKPVSDQKEHANTKAPPFLPLRDTLLQATDKEFVFTYPEQQENSVENYVLRRSSAGAQDPQPEPASFQETGKTGKKQYKGNQFNADDFKVQTFFDTLKPDDKITIIHNALSNARSNNKRITNQKRIFEQREKQIFKHQIHWHKKYTLSFACIIFFFIGAPLGSIIRKGGLGMPLVISVILFIIYYIISITGENFVEKGVFPAFIGMWLSSLLFLPVGIFLTYKATNDSVILNTETYIKAVKRILRLQFWENGKSGSNKPDDFHEQ